MTKKIKVGYMGIPFSNTEAMALEFLREMNWKDTELIALMSSKATVDALLKGEIDYGVLAVRNSSAGEVGETKESLEGIRYRKILEGSEHIHHCLFVKGPEVKVNCICSHIQALGQCRQSLEELFPGIKQKDCSDTAYAAEMLSKGELPEDCAVICRKSAGEHYGLCLLMENIEDRGDNETFFYLVSL